MMEVAAVGSPSLSSSAAAVSAAAAAPLRSDGAGEIDASSATNPNAT